MLREKEVRVSLEGRVTEFLLREMGTTGRCGVGPKFRFAHECFKFPRDI